VYKLPGLMKQSYTESLSNSVYNKKMQVHLFVL
jgi:hypothetical protein